MKIKKMYLENKYLTSPIVIGGGYKTAPHIKSGGWRVDFVSQYGFRYALADMEYIMDAPNGDGTRYAVYKIINTCLYIFYVHIYNPRKGVVKRDEVAFDLLPIAKIFLHIHVKKNKYGANDRVYYEFLKGFNPKYKITTNYGSNAYTGKNAGEQLPCDTSNSDDNEMVKLKHGDSIRVQLDNTTKNSFVRNDKSLKAPVVATLPPGDKTEYNISAVGNGDEVNGTKTWYHGIFNGIAGWISGTLVIEVKPKDNNCDAELTRIEALKAQVGNLKNKQSQINTKAKEIDNLSK